MHCYLGFGTVKECPSQCRGECGYKPKAVETMEDYVGWNKEQDRVWTEFLNVLCGRENGEIPVFDDDEAKLDRLLTEVAQAAVQPGVDFLTEGLDEPSPADDDECGTMRDGMRGFTGGKPWAG
jgi:hypothetical protein